MFDSLIPLASDVGATAVIFALLIYSFQQGRMNHERILKQEQAHYESQLQRDKALIDFLANVNLALLECVKEVRSNG